MDNSISIKCKESNNTINGSYYSLKNKCIDCGKIICNKAKRCVHCGNLKKSLARKIEHLCPICHNEIKRYNSKLCQRCYHKNKISVGSHYKRYYYKNIYFKSSYEYKYALYLDKNNIKWQYEAKSFDLGNTSYRPDFYLSETDEWIEIKGWWRPDAKIKFDLFRAKFPNIKIIVLYKNDLIKEGIL